MFLLQAPYRCLCIGSCTCSEPEPLAVPVQSQGTGLAVGGQQFHEASTQELRNGFSLVVAVLDTQWDMMQSPLQDNCISKCGVIFREQWTYDEISHMRASPKHTTAYQEEDKRKWTSHKGASSKHIAAYQEQDKRKKTAAVRYMRGTPGTRWTNKDTYRAAWLPRSKGLLPIKRRVAACKDRKLSI